MQSLVDGTKTYPAAQTAQALTTAIYYHVESLGSQIKQLAAVQAVQVIEVVVKFRLDTKLGAQAPIP